MSHYSMLIQWSDRDHCFIVTLPEFEDVKTHGDTYEEAVRMGKELVESCIMWHQQDGRPLPKPRKFVNSAA